MLMKIFSHKYCVHDILMNYSTDARLIYYFTIEYIFQANLNESKMTWKLILQFKNVLNDLFLNRLFIFL